jgi:hypothetical protein
MIKDLDFIKILNFKEIEDCQKNNSVLYKTKCILREYLKNYPEDENNFYHPDKSFQKFLKNWKFISSGGWASVYSFNLNDTQYKAIYKTYLGKAMNEYITALVLNRITNKTPNFMHTYAGIICSTNIEEEEIKGLCEDTKDVDNIFFFEWIDGENMSKWLKRKDITVSDIINVLSQVFFSLLIANYYFDFLHNDLHPDNIMIVELSDPIEFQYDLPLVNKKIKMKIKYLVKILDFGESDINRVKVIEYLNNEKNIISKSNQGYMIDINNLMKILKTDLNEIDKENFIEEWIKIKELN